MFQVPINDVTSANNTSHLAPLDGSTGFAFVIAIVKFQDIPFQKDDTPNVALYCFRREVFVNDFMVYDSTFEFDPHHRNNDPENRTKLFGISPKEFHVHVASLQRTKKRADARFFTLPYLLNRVNLHLKEWLSVSVFLKIATLLLVFDHIYLCTAANCF